MGNVDHRLKLDILQRVCQDLLDAQHHQATVAEGELNAVLHLVPVRTKLLGTLRQERHVDLRRDDRVPFFVERRSQLVVIVSDLLAEVSRPRVDHDPERTLLVLLQLDEVVAATERTDLIANGVLAALHDLQLVDVEAVGRYFSSCASSWWFIPSGMRARMPVMICSRMVSAERFSTFQLVLTAHIPQPISTPTALGTTTPSQASTPPIGIPMPACTSGMMAK